MSLSARRYQPYYTEDRKEGRLFILTRHHVPPRNPARHAPITLRKDERHHRAYHLLFRNAGTFQQCVEILRREWWSDPNGNPIT